MSEQPLALTSAQFAQISNATAGGTTNFVQGYNLINSFISAAGSSDTLGPQSTYWYSQAPNINGNVSTSPANTYIRTDSGYGLAWSGTTSPNLQATSNSIAKAVIQNVINTSSLPTIQTLLSSDISAALGAGGQTIGGWGGAFFYWNTVYTQVHGQPETVGQAIESSPTEYAKFVAANATALVAAIGTAGTQYKSLASLEADVNTVFNTIWKAQAPAGVEADIANRAASMIVFGNSAAGNPDYIDGYTYLGANPNGSGIWGNVTTPGDIPVITLAPTTEGQQLDSLRQTVTSEQGTSYPPSGISGDEDDGSLGGGANGPVIVPSTGSGGAAAGSQLGSIVANPDGSFTSIQPGASGSQGGPVPEVIMYSPPNGSAESDQFSFNVGGNYVGQAITDNSGRTSSFTSGSASGYSTPPATVNSGDNYTTTDGGVTINLGPSVLLQVGGTGDLVTGSSTDTVQVHAGLGVAVDGDDVTVALAGGDSLTAWNTLDNITASGSNSVVSENNSLSLSGSGTLNLSGTGNTVVGSSNSIVDFATSTGAAVNGDGVHISLFGNDTLTAWNTWDYINVAGNGNTVTSENNAITFTGGGSMNLSGDASIIASNTDTISLATGSQATIDGNGVSFSLAGSDTATAWNTDDNISVVGGSNDLTSENNAISFNGAGSLTLSGTSNTVTAASDDQLDLATSTEAAIDGDNVAVALAGNDTATAWNTQDTINIAGSTNDLTSQLNTLVMGAGSSANVTGNSNTADLASGDDFSVSGGSETVRLTSSDTTFLTGTVSQLQSDNVIGQASDQAVFNDTSSNTSQAQTFDSTSAIDLQFTDYTALNGQGTATDTTDDYTSGASSTTLDDPTSSVSSATEDYSSSNDTGELTSLDYDEGDDYFDDLFGYGGGSDGEAVGADASSASPMFNTGSPGAGTLVDFYQTVENSRGTVIAEDEYNASGALIKTISGPSSYAANMPNLPTIAGPYGAGKTSAAASVAAVQTGTESPTSGGTGLQTLAQNNTIQNIRTAMEDQTAQPSAAVTATPDAATISSMEASAQARMAQLVQAMATFGTQSESLQTHLQTSFSELHDPYLAVHSS